MIYATNMVYTLPNGGIFSARLTRKAGRKELVTRRDYDFGGQPVYWYATAYDLLGRPTNATDSASLAREWLYNRRYELSAASIGTNFYGYAYDTIGNRLWASANLDTNAYVANCLNQYTAISGGPTSVSAAYDLDGDLTNDGVYSYAYDAENRLVSVTSAAETNGAIRVLNTYDHRHRRIRKVVQRLSLSVSLPPAPPSETREWQTVATHTFVWDGNLPVHETVQRSNGSTVERSYFWGMDKSGTEQGAGGVGGLLAVSVNGAFFIPCYDHNGNIVRYVSEDGSTAAQYTYDPYGNTTEVTGPLADEFPFGFSTKYHDRETGLVYYLMRFYRPPDGRWLNHDPIEEEGGLNLYGFCGNNPIFLWDVLGLDELDDIEAMYRKIIAGARERGANVAADNLEYFLSSNAGSKTMSVTWLRGFSSVIQGESTNKARFEVKLREKAKSISNGSQVIFNDYWDAMQTGDAATELYYASGTFTITSYGTFSLSRKGCVVSISGNVDHYWWDPYDWHAGWQAKIPGFGVVNDSDALKLQKAGRAAAFLMESEWNQDFAATYNLEKHTWERGWGSVSNGTSGARETVIAEFGDIARRPTPSAPAPSTPPSTTSPSPTPKQRWSLR